MINGAAHLVSACRRGTGVAAGGVSRHGRCLSLSRSWPRSGCPHCRSSGPTGSNSLSSCGSALATLTCLLLLSQTYNPYQTFSRPTQRLTYRLDINIDTISKHFARDCFALCTSFPYNELIISLKVVFCQALLPGNKAKQMVFEQVVAILGSNIERLRPLNRLIRQAN